MLKKYYAGIGSRSLTRPNRLLIYSTAKFLTKEGYILRSGGAQGCDRAFEKACDKFNGKKEIYLPWRWFENNGSPLYLDNMPNADKALEIASHYHPAWNKLSEGARKLHARNCYQILGQDLNTPVDFVVCYTKNGEMVGGTAQALRIAKDYNVSIVNIGNNKQRAKLIKRIGYQENLKTIPDDWDTYSPEGKFLYKFHGKK